jgi:hypothetical protein
MANTTAVYCTKCFWKGRRATTRAAAHGRLRLADRQITRKPCPYCFKRVTLHRESAGYTKLRGK